MAVSERAGAGHVGARQVGRGERGGRREDLTNDLQQRLSARLPRNRRRPCSLA